MIEKQPASLGLEAPQTPGQTESTSVAAPLPSVPSSFVGSSVVSPPASSEPAPAPSVTAPVAPLASPPTSAAVHAVPAGVTPAAEDAVAEKASDALPSEADYGAVPDSFSAMGLRPEVLRAVTEMGFQAPTPVQRRAYRPMLAGRDLIVQARTGSGKTAAFGLPFAQGLVDSSIPCKDGRIQALVLVPTRELALQVANEVGRLVAYRNLTLTAVYGGAPMGKQVDALKAGSHIVAGTPGRVLDHIRRGTLNLESVRSLVLDEADEMLSMGFLEDMIEIIKRCPPTRQTLLFSATMPDDIVRISNRYLKSPLTLALSEGSVSATEIVHAYYMIPGVGRMRDLLRVLQVERPESAVIFCNTREETSGVAEFLCKNGLDAEPLSSDLTQAERERVMARSKKKALKYLVATDVAARGIDISDLSHVINYSFPESAEVYIHRTGRTGRAGKSGVAISLISPHELGNFYYTKLAYKIRPTERTLPSEAELQTLREGQIIDRLQSEFGERRSGPEARSLVKRILASEDGERLIALIVEQYVQKQAQRSATAGEVEAAPTPAAAEAPRRERPPQEARPAPRGDAPVEEGRRSAERDNRDSRERRDFRDRGDRGPRPEGRPRREFGEGREPREVREPREAREPRDVSVPREVREPRAAREPREVREPREAREPRDAREPREVREAREPRPAREPRELAQSPSPVLSPPEPSREARRPSRPSAPPNRPPAADDIIQVDDGRDFWEAWVDSRSQGGDAPSAHGLRPEGEVEGDDEGRRSRRRERPQTVLAPGDVRLYLNLGRRDQVTEEALQDFFGQRGLGRLNIELHTTHTYVFASETQAAVIITALHGGSFGGRSLICERARR